MYDCPFWTPSFNIMLKDFLQSCIHLYSPLQGKLVSSIPCIKVTRNILDQELDVIKLTQIYTLFKCCFEYSFLEISSMGPSYNIGLLRYTRIVAAPRISAMRIVYLNTDEYTQK